MPLRLLLLLSLLFWAQATFAAPACSGVLKSLPRAFNSPNIHDQQKILAEIGASLGLDLSNLKIIEGLPDKSPVYNVINDAIKFSINDNNISTVAIFTHEFTHAIVERYMFEFSATWRRLRQRSSSISIEIDSLYDSVNKQPNALEQDNILTKVRQLRKEQKILKNQQHLMTAYHEFIADALPTMMYQDKNIMMTSVASLNLSQGNDAQLSLRWRSFENHFDKAEHKIWIDQVNRIQNLSDYYNPYDLLAPLRASMGSLFLSKVHNLTDLKNMMPKLLDILKNDFEQRVDFIGENSSKINADEMNETLLKHLANI